MRIETVLYNNETRESTTEQRHFIYAKTNYEWETMELAKSVHFTFAVLSKMNVESS